MIVYGLWVGCRVIAIIQSAADPVVPAVVEVEIESLPLDGILEQIFEHGVVGFFLKLQRACIGEELSELVS